MILRIPRGPGISPCDYAANAANFVALSSERVMRLFVARATRSILNAFFKREPAERDGASTERYARVGSLMADAFAEGTRID
jgi:hypothetical protein